MTFFLSIVVFVMILALIGQHIAIKDLRASWDNSLDQLEMSSKRADDLAYLVELVSFVNAKERGEQYGMTYTPGQERPFEIKGIRSDVSRVLQMYNETKCALGPKEHAEYERLMRQLINQLRDETTNDLVGDIIKD